eukprot:403368775
MEGITKSKILVIFDNQDRLTQLEDTVKCSLLENIDLKCLYLDFKSKDLINEFEKQLTEDLKYQRFNHIHIDCQTIENEEFIDTHLLSIFKKVDTIVQYSSTIKIIRNNLGNQLLMNVLHFVKKMPLLNQQKREHKWQKHLVGMLDSQQMLVFNVNQDQAQLLENKFPSNIANGKFQCIIYDETSKDIVNQQINQSNIVIDCRKEQNILESLSQILEQISESKQNIFIYTKWVNDYENIKQLLENEEANTIKCLLDNEKPKAFILLVENYNFSKDQQTNIYKHEKLVMIENPCKNPKILLDCIVGSINKQ